jgi:YgiT-type zinc finger domain-containing protein
MRISDMENENTMICHRCGSGKMEEQKTDLPFKLDVSKILIIKQIPAFVCNSCGEIMLDDKNMAKVDEIIDNIRGIDSELEVVRFAA